MTITNMHMYLYTVAMPSNLDVVVFPKMKKICTLHNDIRYLMMNEKYGRVHAIIFIMVRECNHKVEAFTESKGSLLNTVKV